MEGDLGGRAEEITCSRQPTLQMEKLRPRTGDEKVQGHLY